MSDHIEAMARELIKADEDRAGPSEWAIDVQSAIVRYDTEIATAALADFILIGHQKVGSYKQRKCDGCGLWLIWEPEERHE